MISAAFEYLFALACVAGVYFAIAYLGDTVPAPIRWLGGAVLAVAFLIVLVAYYAGKGRR